VTPAGLRDLVRQQQAHSPALRVVGIRATGRRRRHSKQRPSFAWHDVDLALHKSHQVRLQADEVPAGHAINFACKVGAAGGDQGEGVGAAGAPIK